MASLEWSSASLQKKYRELVAANMDGISEAFVVN